MTHKIFGYNYNLSNTPESDEFEKQKQTLKGSEKEPQKIQVYLEIIKALIRGL